MDFDRLYRRDDCRGSPPAASHQDWPAISRADPDRPHRRLLLASISFFVTFLAARLLVASITHHVGPFGYVIVGGRHIHHLVWGILLLLVCGYATLAEAGTQDAPLSILASRLLSIGYGSGAALTLDEFALWLNLDPQAYWSSQDRESIDAPSSSEPCSQSARGGAPMLRLIIKPDRRDRNG
ncbi:hypothetical protein [Edaphobacter aggregans]|uniref:hypothetical protein n=1 Tax=Edaphobacter aggregans TaxID=570835 RepID=UPI001FDEB3A6|nr:hypothetical protein [Edaphobacter aggregans]